jgi:hypothetical protein
MQTIQWEAERYPPAKRCIYARSDEQHRGPFSNEHIVPYGLQPRGGDWYLPEASCSECANITKKYEDHCLRATMGIIREQMDLKTRRNKNRGKPIELYVKAADGTLRKTSEFASNLARYCIGFRMSLPGLLRGAAPWENEYKECHAVVKFPPGEIEGYMKRAQPDRSGLFLGSFRIIDHARMLAKIAHAYAYAKCGPDSFEPYLLDLITARAQNVPYLVGGLPGTAMHDSSLLHHVFPTSVRTAHTSVTYLAVIIRLFALFDTPTYIVIVGKQLRALNLEPLDSASWGVLQPFKM